MSHEPAEIEDALEPRCIEMPDADVLYWQRVALPVNDASLLERLVHEVAWRQEEITLWGKRHLQPRLTAWYGDSQSVYSYSGIRLQPLPWSDLLLDLKQRVEALALCSFNSVLLNYYRNERDSMGMHSDDEPELGVNPIIASLSVGEERMLVFKHKRRKDLAPVRVPLASGSVLLMRGATQHHWKHGIDKQSRPCKPRINLTFRRILS